MAVFNRIISDGVTVACWFSVSMPVRKAATKSARGKFDGARSGMLVPKVAFTGARNRRFRIAGKVGLVT